MVSLDLSKPGYHFVCTPHVLEGRIRTSENENEAHELSASLLDMIHFSIIPQEELFDEICMATFSSIR